MLLLDDKSILPFFRMQVLGVAKTLQFCDLCSPRQIKQAFSGRLA